MQKKTYLLRYRGAKWKEMRTRLHKSEKTTEIYFNEASPMFEIRTHNTDLKKRLTAYGEQHPELCRMTDEDEETGYKSFVIAKRRFFIRLTASYREERRSAGSEYRRARAYYSQEVANNKHKFS